MIIQENGKEFKVKCPICGRELNGKEYFGEVWGAMLVVESHVSCPKCTYREEMCYSEPVKFICETDSIQNRRKAEQLGIEIIPEEEYDLF